MTGPVNARMARDMNPGPRCFTLDFVDQAMACLCGRTQQLSSLCPSWLQSWVTRLARVHRRIHMYRCASNNYDITKTSKKFADVERIGLVIFYSVASWLQFRTEQYTSSDYVVLSSVKSAVSLHKQVQNDFRLFAYPSAISNFEATPACYPVVPLVLKKACFEGFLFVFYRIRYAFQDFPSPA